ncbi:MAG: BlaI/MecI/CopY family transcriptional regulator [Clostridiales bacterium]|nr:BlaI/MecI/CopY family transcriptional regulator [Clostridiales bacterium]
MDVKIFDAEYRFMEIVWESSPVNSTELVKLCEERLGWKKSTTYTTIRRLVKRGVIRNENATVSYIMSKDDIRVAESKEHLKKMYNGSLKMFMTSFLEKETLTEKEVMELKMLIDSQIKGEGRDE